MGGGVYHNSGMDAIRELEKALGISYPYKTGGSFSRRGIFYPDIARGSLDRAGSDIIDSDKLSDHQRYDRLDSCIKQLEEGE